MLSNLFLSSEKQAGSSRVTFPHTCLASGIAAGSGALGELGLYQAALGLLSQTLLLFVLGCLH